jgi:hypothetical protein
MFKISSHCFKGLNFVYSSWKVLIFVFLLDFFSKLQLIALMEGFQLSISLLQRFWNFHLLLGRFWNFVLAVWKLFRHFISFHGRFWNLHLLLWRFKGLQFVSSACLEGFFFFFFVSLLWRFWTFHVTALKVSSPCSKGFDSFSSS